MGMSLAFVYHVTAALHLDIDYFRAQFAWSDVPATASAPAYTGGKQNMNFINNGTAGTGGAVPLLAASDIAVSFAVGLRDRVRRNSSSMICDGVFFSPMRRPMRLPPAMRGCRMTSCAG